MESLSSRKRVLDVSDELEFDMPEVKKLREDLLGVLDESDVCTASQDLDSFMKSFEDEISAKSSPTASAVDLTSESGDSQPDLGYLFGASDDELGLPPSVAELNNSGETDLLTESVDLSNEFWGLGDQLTSYDSFEYGYEFADVGNTGDYVAFEDGLFDYTDLGFGSADVSWKPETLPVE